MSRRIPVLTALLSHWRRNPLQLLALVVGLMMATALLSGVQALNEQARQSYDRAAQMLGGSQVDALARADGDRFLQAAFVTLRRAGWEVSPVLEGRIEIAGQSVGLIGIEPVSMPAAAMLGGADQTSAPGGLGGFLTPPYQAMIAPATLADLGLEAATQAELAGGAVLPPFSVQPDLAPGVIMTDIGVAQRLLNAPGMVSRLLIDPTAPTPTTNPATLTGEPLERRVASEAGDLARLTDSFHLNLTAFGMLAFLVGLFIVYSAITLAFEQRLGMFRTLRACGVSARGLTAMLLLELLVIALVAGALGVALGYAIAAALMPNVAASLDGLYGAEVPGTLALRPSWWLLGVLTSVLGALAAASVSLVRAWRLPPLATGQRIAWRMAQARWLRWQGLVAAVLLVLAVLLVWRGSGLVAAFGSMAALLLGGALALPPVLGAILRLASGRARGPLSEWFWADSRQQMSGLTMALMALLLALSANIGVGTMVDGFRQTFTGWLDRRLVAEIYLDAGNADQSAQIAAWLGQRPEVDAVLPTLRAEVELEGWPATLIGYVDHATYRDNWPVIHAAPDLWDRVAAGDGVLVSEQLAKRAGLRLGDAVTLGSWTPRVVAIYPDYGNPRGQVSGDYSAVEVAFPNAYPGGTGLRLAPEDVPPMMAALGQEFDLGDRMIDQASLKAYSTRIFEQTFAVTGALNVLTMLVAGVAMFMSLLTLAEMRLPQLAPLWAAGVTRRKLAGLELAKTLALALLTAVLAVPLGLAVAWLLVAVVNVEAFGWRLPLHLFPAQWAWLILLAAVTAVLAAALPVLRLARMSPARLVRVFADER